MTLKHLRTIALAATLIGGTAGAAFAQAGGTSGATGAQGGAAKTTNGSETNTPAEMQKNGTSSNQANKGAAGKSATDGKMGDCPVGMARTAAPDNTKGPCQKI
ncbi:MAG: hypothetical protein ACXWJT_14715 [Xanthobacteraceae bacterium]